jgi:hypothetical protein
MDYSKSVFGVRKLAFAFFKLVRELEFPNQFRRSDALRT